MHAMKYIFIILNLGTRWSVVTLTLLPWTSDTCLIVCWISTNAGVNGLENTKTSCPLWTFKTWIIQLVTILWYLGSKQRQQRLKSWAVLYDCIWQSAGQNSTPTFQQLTSCCTNPILLMLCIGNVRFILQKWHEILSHYHDVRDSTTKSYPPQWVPQP